MSEQETPTVRIEVVQPQSESAPATADVEESLEVLESSVEDLQEQVEEQSEDEQEFEEWLEDKLTELSHQQASIQQSMEMIQSEVRELKAQMSEQSRQTAETERAEQLLDSQQKTPEIIEVQEPAEIVVVDERSLPQPNDESNGGNTTPAEEKLSETAPAPAPNPKKRIRFI